MTGTAHSPTAGFRLFPSPEAIMTEMPLPPAAAAGIARSRAEVAAIMNGSDDRLLVITEPPAPDPEAALDYAERLAGTGMERDLLIVVQAYPEKPRPAIQRTGLPGDRAADGSHDGLRALKEARKLLADLAMLGMPAASEWLSAVTPHYLADAVSWSAIGARLTDNQIRRQLASAMPVPTGISAAGGDVSVAAEECKAAAASHTFLGIIDAGAVGVVTSRGNPACHVILRGDGHRPSYGPQAVAGALEAIENAGLPRRVIIDLSQDGSGRGHRRQEAAAIAVAGQVAGGERGLAGVMLDSSPISGHPEPGLLPSLFHGQRIASTCADLPVAAVLEVLATAVQARRRLLGAPH
jgi:3-deoxy-7-phosphoheptulonate synthase